MVVISSKANRYSGIHAEIILVFSLTYVTNIFIYIFLILTNVNSVNSAAYQDKVAVKVENPLVLSFILQLVIFLHQTSDQKILSALYIKFKTVATKQKTYTWQSELFKDVIVTGDQLITISMKREFKKLFFVIRDQKVFRDP